MELLQGSGAFLKVPAGARNQGVLVEQPVQVEGTTGSGL